MAEEEQTILVIGAQIKQEIKDPWINLLERVLQQNSLAPDFCHHRRFAAKLRDGHYKAVIVNASNVDDPLTVIREVRQLSTNMPILAVKWTADYSGARDIFKAGASDFFLKVLDESRLLNDLSKTVLPPQ